MPIPFPRLIMIFNALLIISSRNVQQRAIQERHQHIGWRVRYTDGLRVIIDCGFFQVLLRVCHPKFILRKSPAST